MIRRLLVQQQEADATIQELSDSLQRIGPVEKEHLNLSKQPTAAKTNGFGQPAMGPQHRRSPWHEKAEEQDIHTILQPEAVRSSRSSKSSARSRHTNSHNVHTLISPAEMFKKKHSKNQRVTASPNSNPADIKASNSARYQAPAIPKHLDSEAIDSNVFNWGGTAERKAWEGSSDRWRTSHNVHSRANTQRSRRRPASCCSSRTKQSSFASTRRSSDLPGATLDDEFVREGLTREAYSQLAGYNSEMFGKVKHDPEIIPNPNGK